MSIIQISKIQQRSGNLVDLPQLDEAQLGWANDARRLFIGGTVTANTDNENIEVLTAYSNITFSQIEGSYGNLNISIANSNVAANSIGEVLAFDGNNWINAGGNAGGTINLGDVANLKIGGAGGIGYVLQTDGLGNLSWTPKGTLYTNIIGLSNANPIVMTVANTVPYTNQQSITISGVNGASNNVVNGSSFYVKLASNYSVTGNITLYSDILLTVPVNGAGLTYTNSPNAIATAVIGSSGGLGSPGGSNTCVQFNEVGTFGGNAGFTFNNITGALAVPGNISTSNANLGNAVTANYFIGSGANLTNIPAGNVSGAVGLATYATTANAVAGANVSGAVSYATTANAVAGANVSGEVSYAATANAVAGANVSGAVSYATTANAVAGANVSGEVSYAATANSVAGANVSGTVGLATYATTANAVAGANVSGAVSYATTANSVAAANVSGLGNIATINLDGNTSNILYGNGVFAAAPAGGGYGNSNVATFLASYGSNTISTTGTISSGNITLANNSTISVGSSSNVGTITGNWTLSSGSTLQATYADLAEYYEADQHYEPGTVLAFGGDKEVTIAEDATTCVAGVVSTNPAYAMNANCQGIAVAIALQGRVPTKVRGTVRKGDMMVSAGNGFARPTLVPSIGTVIGKSLENFDGIEGIIEVAVGRL